MKQVVLTVAAGKRLIAKATAAHPIIRAALSSGTVCIVCGTTNGYVAEEILTILGQSTGFTRHRFYRGITLPPGRAAAGAGGDEAGPPTDVVIVDGVWQKGQTVYGIGESLKAGDVIIKGANAVNLAARRAAILVGNPTLGTVGVALPAAVGRRAHLLLPVGVEKRVVGDLDALAAIMNAPGGQGPRLLPVPGEILTELDAITLLTGARAELVAAGGVGGAEGCAWFAVTGTPEQEAAAESLLKPITLEPPFTR